MQARFAMDLKANLKREGDVAEPAQRLRTPIDEHYRDGAQLFRSAVGLHDLIRAGVGFQHQGAAGTLTAFGIRNELRLAATILGNGDLELRRAWESPPLQ